ncbi:hypothetical protein HY638_04175 [Candidatus Woesearchaeota archaeon]|nr:hypothetical protein [Candidatus Woesearchaeota archaeon]
MKKGIELSVNFLVVLIIALVLFGMGVKLVYDIFTGSQDLSQITLDEINKKIAELQCRFDDRVCFGVDTIEVERGDVGIFMVKVTNVLGLSGPVDFKMEVTPNTWISREESGEFTDEDIAVKYQEQPESINSNEDSRLGIAVEPTKNARPGTYSFKVSVTCDINSIPDGEFTDDIEEACDSYGSGLVRVKVP